ncbi:unnamed protein product [Ilex paraguariensis]|uniref:Uncharacterized protein n=1 Tax=Ilex paraguariensis TaxID=185542 RepID=A0ABC8TZE9_9AQUA
MELCTARTISNLPLHRTFTQNNTLLRWKSSLPLKQVSISRTNPGLLYYTNSSLRSTTSEETSSVEGLYVKDEPDVVIANEGMTTSEETPSAAGKYVKDEPDDVIANEDDQPVEKNEYVESEVPKEDSPEEDQMQPFEFLENLRIKVNI